ncbi:MAG: class I SAM-dependent methyltransferase [Bryobacterales bacterium]|nr:class I SAM-dependent methyltransferase [Bryobacterales bacterium]MBV9398851.1 class I SAM-dependent methyltransferase [Bryobacterales bacterium]
MRSQRDQWNELARTDPLWAILTDPEKRNGGWNEAEFFASGRNEAAGVMEQAAKFNAPSRRHCALDLGCGVGRATQAFCDYFDDVIGVDIAPAMIEAARAYNQYGKRCRYVLNASSNLRAFSDGAFDLVYSCITLQHLPRRHIRAYLAELIRIVHPQGLLVFQLPDRYRNRKDWLTHTLYGFLMRTLLRRADVMEMHGISKKRVTALLRANGAEVLAIAEDSMAGPKWLGWRYYARRR